MANHIKKSQKKVAGAVSTFTKAVDEVTQANKILAKGIEADEKAFDEVAIKIKNLELKLDDISWNMMQKQQEIKNNSKLAEKLSQFVGGNE